MTPTLTAALVAAGLLLGQAPPADVLALPTQWRDEAGATIGLEAFKGRWYALTFVYTSCAGTCPLTTKKLVRLDGALAKRGRRLPLVVVSLDPERDTPEAVRQYRARYKLEKAKHWSVLVGAEPHLRDLTTLLGFRYTRNPDTGVIGHDNTVFLVGPDGLVRAQMSSLDEPLDAFVAAVPKA